MTTSLFLTSACNLRCAHCFVPTEAGRARDGLTLKAVSELFAELEQMGAPRLVLAGGEPMLRQDLYGILDAVDQHHMDAVLCTNGTLLTAASARRLAASSVSKFSVSLDGPDADSHDAIRGSGVFAKTLRGVRHLLAAGARRVMLRATITPRYLDRMVDFVSLADELGVHELRLKPFRGSGEASKIRELALDPDAYREACDKAWARLPEVDCEVHISDGMPERMPAWTRSQGTFSCTGATVRATVLADGRVVACGAVKDPADWTLHEHSFGECWRDAPTLNSWRQLDAGGTCCDCSQLARCAGACRARALGVGLSMADPDPWAPCPHRPDAP